MGVILFPNAIAKTVDIFLEIGIEKQAVVTHKHIHMQTFNTRYGPSSEDFYFIEVKFKTNQSRQERIMTIKDWVTEEEYHSVKEGDPISVVYLPNDENSEKRPSILLNSTVHSSFIKKIFLSFKGDMTKSGLGLILVVFGIGFTFSGTLLFFTK